MPTPPKFTEIDRMGPSSNGRGGARVRYFLLHTEEGNSSAESLAEYLNNPAHDASYHYALRGGTLVDVVNTDLASWSVGDANSYTINLCFAGSRASWSRAQWLERDNDLRIAAYIAVQDGRKYGFSTAWLGSGGRYKPAAQGVSDHQYVTDIIGWGSHTDVGAGFPGDVFEKYLAEYSGTASSEGETDMPSAQEVANAVWAAQVPKPDGKTEQAGILLGWTDQHGGDALDQAAGPGTKDQREQPLRPTGWPQLGKNPDGSNRSLVDGLAAVLTKTDQIIAAQIDQAARLAVLEAKDKA